MTVATSLLPSGVRVSSGRDERGRHVVCQSFRLKDQDGTEREVSLVLTPREARAHAALVLRQAQLAEEAEAARRSALRVLL